MTSKKIAFIGLGVMGYPMAGHLAQAGHAVTVYNRTGAKADAWTACYGGHRAATPGEAAAAADFVMTCVGNDDDLRSVMAGADGVLSGMQRGTIIVDHTTASARIAREMSALALEHGGHFLDAPVSGGQAGAEQGRLSVMCGGTEAAFAAADPVLRCYARACARMGPSGSGQLAKMVNQICIAGLLQALAEGLNFGVRAGLDMEQVLAVIGKGAAQSWQMDNRAGTMLQNKFDFGFAVDWARKDLKLCLEQAEQIGATLPITALVGQFYQEISGHGGGRMDTSSLISRLNRQNTSVCPTN